MGRLQKIPPAAPRASSVTNDARLLFGNPNVAPNKGIIDVRNPTGMRVVSLASGRFVRFDIRTTIVAERAASTKNPPQSPAKEPGSISARTNMPRMNIATNIPVIAPKRKVFFQLIQSLMPE